MVYAEFDVVHHVEGKDNLRAVLAEKFGRHDPNVLDHISIFKENPQWKNLVLFSNEHPGSRTAFFWKSPTRVAVHIQPLNDNVFYSTQETWKELRSALGSDIKIEECKLIDNTAAVKDVMRGSAASWTGELKKRENATPLVLSIVAVAWIAIGLATFAQSDQWKFISGAVAAVAAGILALMYILLETRSKTLKWDGVR
jgi:hypothetical protein